MINLTYAEERIKRIVQKGMAPGRNPSDPRLLWEYVRRVSQLQANYGASLGGLFFNPLDLLAKDVEAFVNEKERLKKLTSGVNNFICAQLMQYYVLWEVFARERDAVVLLEPKLYEPLIRMFERGSSFTLHNHEAIFHRRAVPLTMWTQPPFAEEFKLDDNSLDQFDKAYTLKTKQDQCKGQS